MYICMCIYIYNIVLWSFFVSKNPWCPVEIFPVLHWSPVFLGNHPTQLWMKESLTWSLWSRGSRNCEVIRYWFPTSLKWWFGVLKFLMVWNFWDILRCTPYVELLFCWFPLRICSWAMLGILPAYLEIEASNSISHRRRHTTSPVNPQVFIWVLGVAAFRRSIRLRWYCGNL